MLTTNKDVKPTASTTPTDVGLAVSGLPLPLSRIRDGERCWLASTELCCEDCELLRAMGLTEQCEIRVCRSGGATCIVQVKSTRLGLSATLAENILVSRAPRSAG